MTKQIVYKCQYCKFLWVKEEVRSEECPRCEKPDWSLTPIQYKAKGAEGDIIIGTIEHGTDGLITFFPEKLVPWNIRQLANLIKSLATYD